MVRRKAIAGLSSFEIRSIVALPLLIPAYSEILVVDLRYVRPDVISEELDLFHDADILFLYSTTVLNAPGAFPVS